MKTRRDFLTDAAFVAAGLMFLPACASSGRCKETNSLRGGTELAKLTVRGGRMNERQMKAVDQ